MSHIDKIDFSILPEPWDCYQQTGCPSIHKISHLSCNFLQLVEIDQDTFLFDQKLLYFHPVSLSFCLSTDGKPFDHWVSAICWSKTFNIVSVMSVNMAAPSPIISELGETTLCFNGSFDIEACSL